MDSEGNVYVSGGATAQSSDNLLDFLTRKLSATGEEIWQQRYNGPATEVANTGEQVTALALGAEYLYVTGNIYSETGGIAIMIYDHDGNLVREVLQAGSHPAGIQLDQEGNFYVVGFSQDQAVGYGYILAKYTAQGDLVWSKTHLTDAFSVLAPLRFVVAADGDLWLATEVARPNPQHQMAPSLLIARYTSDGTPAWETEYAGTEGRGAKLGDFVLDSTGNAYVAATTYPPGDWRYVLALLKFGATGSLLHQQLYQDMRPFDDRAIHLQFDKAGMLVVAGAGFDQESFVYTLRIDLAGNLIWAARYPGVVPTVGALAIGPGAVTVAGAVNRDGFVAPYGLSAAVLEQYVSVADGLFLEGDERPYEGEAIFQVRLRSPALRPVKVAYTTVDGSAIQEVDYEAQAGVINFLVGDYLIDIPVKLLGNADPGDPPKSFELKLTCAQQAMITDHEGIATILDDDQLQPSWQDHQVANLPNAATGPPLAHFASNGDRVILWPLAGNTGLSMQLLRYTKYGELLWRRSYAAPLSALTLDQQGNIYVAGSLVTPSGKEDLLAAKFDSGGDLLWERTVDGPIHDDGYARAVTVDRDGNVLIAGVVTIVPFLLNTEPDQQPYNSDMIILKYDNGGNLLWVQTYENPTQDIDSASHLSADLLGNIYVGGISIYNRILSLPTLLKYNKEGHLQWVVAYQHPGYPAVDHSLQQMNVSNTGAISIMGKVRSEGSYFAHLSSNGNVLWDISCAAVPFCRDNSATFQNFGFDGNGDPTLLLGGANGSILAAYTESGGLNWTRPVYSYPLVYDLIADQSGAVYLATGRKSLDSSLDLFLLGYGPSGEERLRQRLLRPNAPADHYVRVLVDNEQNVHLVVTYPNELLIFKFPPPAPPVLLAPIGSGAVEDELEVGEVQVRVVLTAPQAGEVAVRYFTMDGSAHAGEDYAHTAGVVTIPPGSVEGTIHIPILPDKVAEPLEFFFVNLEDATGAGLRASQALVILWDQAVLRNLLPFVNR